MDIRPGDCLHSGSRHNPVPGDQEESCRITQALNLINALNLSKANDIHLNYDCIYLCTH